MQPLQPALNVDINHLLFLTTNSIGSVHLTIIQQLHNMTLINPEPVAVGVEDLLGIAGYGYLLVIDQFVGGFVHVPIGLNL